MKKYHHAWAYSGLPPQNLKWGRGENREVMGKKKEGEMGKIVTYSPILSLRTTNNKHTHICVISFYSKLLDLSIVVLSN